MAFLLDYVMNAPGASFTPPRSRSRDGEQESPMPDDVQDANAVSSPAPDAPAPSADGVPVQEQVSQEGTAPTTPSTPEPQFNMPPAERWEELRQQRAAAEERAQRAEAMARMALERVQAPQGAPAEDPWAGLVNHPDPATAQFYQQQQRLFQHEARRVSEQQSQSLMQAVDAGRRELAGMKISQFRKENPEIKLNSPEEHAIAGFVGQGYDLETAKKLALYDRQEQELLALKAKQSSVGGKVAANQTGPTQGMPATAGLPGQPGDWRNNVRTAFRKGGGLAEIVNAAGATKVSE